jgi:3-oxoacyl-[acyl-carrier-protein] synthase III
LDGELSRSGYSYDALHLKRIGVSGVAGYIPRTKVAMTDWYDTETAKRLTKSTGIVERGLADDTETLEYMGIEAGKRVMQLCKLNHGDIDALVFSTRSIKKGYNPNAAAAEIGGYFALPENCVCAVDCACSGSLKAIQAGAQQILAGAKRVLVIASERPTDNVEHFSNDKIITPLFGDGASAMLIEQDGTHPLLHVYTGTVADPDNLITYEDTIFTDVRGKEKQDIVRRMTLENGKKLYQKGVEGMTRMLEEAAQGAVTAGRARELIRSIALHQANLRMVNNIVANWGAGPEIDVLNCGKYTANTVSASIGMAIAASRVRTGVIIMGAFGVAPDMEQGKLSFGTATIDWQHDVPRTLDMH